MNHMNTKPSTIEGAFEYGYRCRCDRVEKEDNPYYHSGITKSPLGQAWTKGWVKADKLLSKE